MNLFKNKSTFFLTLFILLFTSALAVFSQTQAPPNESKTAPINTGDISQIKNGGLGLAIGSPGTGIPGPSVGLLVNRLGIKQNTATPAEALELVGDIFIKGIITTNGIKGRKDQILAVNSSGTAMQWQSRYAWLTLTNTDPGFFAPYCGDLTCNKSGIQPENCSNCPHDCKCTAHAMCVQGECKFPNDPPPVVPPPPGCGNGTIDPGEECDNSACSPAIYTCSGGSSVVVPRACQSCSCVPTVPLPIACIPPPPIQPCGPQPPGGMCGGTCPNPGDACTAGGTSGSCICAPPNNSCGKTYPQCNGTCPPDESCIVFGGSCRCSGASEPGNSQSEPNSQLQTPSYLGFLDELGSGIKVAEAAADCAGEPLPRPCPSGWTPYAQVCALLSNGTQQGKPFWVRSCYQNK